MSRSPSSLTPADLRLLYEAVSYARRRSFTSADTIRLKGIQNRLDELILGQARGVETRETETPDGSATGPGTGPPASPGGQLRLSPPEQEVLARQIPVYCEALTQRGAAAEGAAEAARLRELLAVLTGKRRGLRGKFRG